MPSKQRRLLTCFVSYFCFCIEKVALEGGEQCNSLKLLLPSPRGKVLISLLCSDGAPASLL